MNIGETGSFNVKKHSNTREITAIYNIETSSVELCIRLPMNYPLSHATVECTRHVGFTKEQWNKWMFQLKTSLVQNVSFLLNKSILYNFIPYRTVEFLMVYLIGNRILTKQCKVLKNVQFVIVFYIQIMNYLNVLVEHVKRNFTMLVW